MRATRNRVYRKLYRGFESPYLRQRFAPHFCGENLWWRYWAWTKRPQLMVAGFGTSAQSARSERGPSRRSVNAGGWELQSPYLRQIKMLKIRNRGFFDFNQGDRGMCASSTERSTQYADEQLEKS